MRKSRRDMQIAYHRFAIARLQGHDVATAAKHAGVSRASAFRFEQRRKQQEEP